MPDEVVKEATSKDIEGCAAPRNAESLQPASISNEVSGGEARTRGGYCLHNMHSRHSNEEPPGIGLAISQQELLVALKVGCGERAPNELLVATFYGRQGREPKYYRASENKQDRGEDCH